jgi:sialate O-acetylesterase
LALAIASPAFGAGGAPTTLATTHVSPLIGDHMVVQRGRPVRLSGTDLPGRAVRASLAGRSGSAKTDAAGRWQIALPALDAGGPFTLTIEGSRALSFDDVWSGEVWLASGQSNMSLPLMRTSGADEAVAGGCPGIHFFTVPQQTSAEPRGDIDANARWEACNATTAAGFSAVAFHFGREIHRTLGVPVGLLHASWGGTPAEAWTPRPALLGDPTLKPMVDALDAFERDPQRKADLQKALDAWEAKNFHQDTGNRGERLGFAKAGGAGWPTMKIPQTWESAGLDIDGAVWFKREVTLPEAWAGRELALSLGALDDFDVTYWNGERVGATGAETPQYWSAERHYTVPARLAKAGRNIVAVRVFDHYGSGGFAGTAAQLTVAPIEGEAAPLSLAGPWQYKIERKLPPAKADWNTRPLALGADDPQSPTVLWNGMVAPLLAPAPLPIAGVIWYQGEGNVGRATQYRTLFPTMIRAWRAAWHEPALPFLYVQLPNFDDPLGKGAPLGEGGWADLREAQAAALREPKTAMAVTIDIGEGTNLHPPQKREVGRRLALAALRTVYGRDVLAAGPVFHAAVRAGDAIRVRFEGIAGGLETSDGAQPRGFLIAGADHVWHVAQARIDRDGVVVSSPDVKDPLAVRYGWGDDPPNTLRNGVDLPAAPFRTDDWPTVSAATAAKAAP